MCDISAYIRHPFPIGESHDTSTRDLRSEFATQLLRIYFRNVYKGLCSAAGKPSCGDASDRMRPCATKTKTRKTSQSKTIELQNITLSQNYRLPAHLPRSSVTFDYRIAPRTPLIPSIWILPGSATRPNGSASVLPLPGQQDQQASSVNLTIIPNFRKRGYDSVKTRIDPPRMVHPLRRIRRAQVSLSKHFAPLQARQKQ
jgi:hypothetical protein